MFFSGGGVDFDPEKDIPDLAGKVILVTGGNAGLGEATVRALAQHHPAEIWLAARNLASAQTVVDSIHASTPDVNIHILQLDLSSLASVKTAASTILARISRLDILILNAGIAFNPPALTTDGYELQFGTNQMGHALLTQLLIATLLKTSATSKSNSRIVIVSSTAHQMAKTNLDYASLTTPQESTGTMTRYAQSKLANILMMRVLARHYPSITSVAVHPGAVATTFTRNIAPNGAWYLPILNTLVWLFFAGVAKGARNQLWAAVGEGVVSGGYYEPVGKTGAMSPQAGNDKAMDELWDWTEKELMKHGGGKWVRGSEGAGRGA